MDVEDVLAYNMLNATYYLCSNFEKTTTSDNDKRQVRSTNRVQGKFKLKLLELGTGFNREEDG